MIDSMRAGKAMAGRVRRGGALPWFIAAAASIAAAFFGYITYEMHQPRVLPAYSLLTMGTRGAGSPTVISNHGNPFVLFVDIPPQPASDTYRIEIRDTSNHLKVSVPVNTDQARETVTVYVPPNRLQSGNYTVAIVGGASTTIGTAPIQVR